MPDDLRAQIAAADRGGHGAWACPCCASRASRPTTSSARWRSAPPQPDSTCVISTGDKDMAQLVDERITLVNTMTDSRLDRAGVKAKFDVYPEQIVDYLALVGDSSDNIPGVAKVGPKTAAKWLNEYGDARRAASRTANEIEGKVGESLRAQPRRPRAVAQARDDPTRTSTLPRARRHELDARASPTSTRLRELYTRLELRSLLRQLAGRMRPETCPPRADAMPGGATGEPARRQYRCLGGDARHRGARRSSGTKRSSPRRSSTNGSSGSTAPSCSPSTPRPPASTTCRPRSSVSPSRSSPAMPPTCRSRTTTRARPTSSTATRVLAALKPLLEDRRNTPRSAITSSTTRMCLRNHGIELARHALRLDARVLRAGTAPPPGTTWIRPRRRYLGVDTIHYEDVAGKGAKQIAFSQVPVDKAAEYAAEDADVTLRLHQRAVAADRQRAARSSAVRGNRAAAGAGAAAHGATRRAARHGSMLRKQSSELAKRLHGARAAERTRPPAQPFNLDSPKQLQEDPVRKLRLPVMRKTPTGPALDRRRRARGAGARLRAAEADPGVPRAREAQVDLHRQAARRRSTRAPGACTPATTRPSRQPAGCPRRIRTCRTSRSARAEGRRIRQAFIAPPGSRAAGGRLFADRAAHHGAPVRRRGPAAALSPRTATSTRRRPRRCSARRSTRSPRDQRRSAKAINFGLIYGMSAFGLARAARHRRAARRRNTSTCTSRAIPA